MTDEETFWFVVRKLENAGMNVPLSALRAVQLININRLDALQYECEQLRIRVTELESRQSEIDKILTRRLNKRDEILSVMQECQGDLKQVASRLGIHRSTIYRRIPRLRHVLKGRLEQINEAHNTGKVQSDTVQA